MLDVLKPSRNCPSRLSNPGVPTALNVGTRSRVPPVNANGYIQRSSATVAVAPFAAQTNVDKVRSKAKPSRCGIMMNLNGKSQPATKMQMVSAPNLEAPDEHCWRRRAAWRRLAELVDWADYLGENANVNDLLTLSLKITTFLSGVPGMDPNQPPSDESQGGRSSHLPRNPRSISSDDLMQGEIEIQ